MIDVGEVLSEYVKEEEPDTPAWDTKVGDTKVGDTKTRRTRKRQCEKEVLSHEQAKESERRRDILASVAMLEGLEGYVGDPVSAVEVRRMSEKDLNRVFKLYEVKSGQELIKDALAITAEGIVSGLSFFLSFDDREALKADLMSNKQLGRFIARNASRISEDYGDVVAVLRLAIDVGRHVVYRADEAKDSEIPS